MSGGRGRPRPGTGRAGRCRIGGRAVTHPAAHASANPVALSSSTESILFIALSSRGRVSSANTRQ
jgi:hypothetical protein